MANKAHLDMIKQGVEVWNKWRQSNPSQKPDLFSANLSSADLRNIDLKDANLWEANLKSAKLSGANLSNSDICFADLTGADIKGANLTGANLTEADLTGTTLQGSVLRNVNLWGTKLIGADLSEADLSYSDLSEANLTEANLSEVILRATNFSEAKLIKANLSEADLNKVNLTNADLSEIILKWSSFCDVDLSTTKGLESVRHLGPSSLGIDTIYRSKGNIPEIFLRMSGVPEDFIKLTGTIASQHISLDTFLISYSSRDSEFCERLNSDLRDMGVRSWHIPGDMKSAYKVKQTIRLFDRLLLILSENSIDTDWVEKEAESAFEVEIKTKKTILVPISLDKALMDTNRAWASHLRNTHSVVDFSKWKEAGAYKDALTLLLENTEHTFLKEKKPNQKMDDPKERFNHFPEIHYKLVGNNNCPLYKNGDIFKLVGTSFTAPRDKSTCLILLEDIREAHVKYQKMGSQSGYSFSCSGCTGLIRLEYTKKDTGIPVADETEEYVKAIAGLLNNFSMFQHLDQESITYIVRYLKLKKFGKGDIVIKKGDPGKNLYVIVSGRVDVHGDDGIYLASMGKGDVFGEMSIFSGKPVGATIKVSEPGTIIFITAKDFRRMLTQFPPLQMYFTQLMAQRITEINVKRSEEFGSGMIGKLSEMPPSELFQTFNINQKTGVLHLNLSKGDAEMIFREGSLIRGRYGKLEGIDAFYEVLREKEGRFKFSPGLANKDMESPELGDFMALLMEGIRRIDEDSG